MAHTGYPEAIVNELLNYRVSLAGLTETRLVDADKDTFYQQLDSLISAIPPHDTTIILGDFNAVTGSDRHGFESVIGNYGSGRTNDNSTRLLSLCAAHSLSVLGSWFTRRYLPTQLDLQ